MPLAPASVPLVCLLALALVLVLVLALAVSPTSLAQASGF
jgi:hypothetical protein